jgi:hypothetical protein
MSMLIFPLCSCRLPGGAPLPEVAPGDGVPGSILGPMGCTSECGWMLNPPQKRLAASPAGHTGQEQMALMMARVSQRE